MVERPLRPALAARTGLRRGAASARARPVLAMLLGAAIALAPGPPDRADAGQETPPAGPRSILPDDVFGPAPAAQPAPAVPPVVAPAPPSSVEGGTGPATGPTSFDATASGSAAPGAPGAPGASPFGMDSPGVPGPALTAPDPLDRAAPAADLSLTGLLSPAAGGYGPATFAGSDGRALAVLMRAMRAPVASRWGHILLVRALASIVPTPAAARPADWVAERARLLMRLGESDVAHALVQAVPVDRFTPRLYGVAFDAALAAADPAAICPIAQTGATLSALAVWRLGGALCAAFDGDDIASANAFAALRQSGETDPFDVSIAERVAASAGEGTRASANLEWGEAETINLYRLGLAMAQGASIPDRLLAMLPGPARGWLFRAASVPDAERAAAAGPAAAQGIVGAGELVAFYAALASSPDGGGVGADTAGRLRLAYAGAPADRVAAMRALWDAAPTEDRYAASVLTAGAASALRPDARFAKYAPEIMASALAGGRADAALRWWPLASTAGGSVAARAWALAAVADAAGRVAVTPDAFDAWRKAEAEAEADRDRTGAPRRARLLLAALEGLGRARGGEWDGARRDAGLVPLVDRWSARIDAAAAAGRVGETIVLAGTGMQADWAGMPAAHLTHILAALIRVGRGTEARLIAAEAVARG